MDSKSTLMFTKIEFFIIDHQPKALKAIERRLIFGTKKNRTVRSKFNFVAKK